MKVNKDKVKTVLKGIGVVSINLVLGTSPGASGPILLSNSSRDDESSSAQEEGTPSE
jgi:hypothetical protein